MGDRTVPQQSEVDAPTEDELDTAAKAAGLCCCAWPWCVHTVDGEAVESGAADTPAPSPDDTPSEAKPLRLGYAFSEDGDMRIVTVPDTPSEAPVCVQCGEPMADTPWRVCSANRMTRKSGICSTDPIDAPNTPSDAPADLTDAEIERYENGPLSTPTSLRLCAMARRVKQAELTIENWQLAYDKVAKGQAHFRDKAKEAEAVVEAAVAFREVLDQDDDGEYVPAECERESWKALRDALDAKKGGDS